MQESNLQFYKDFDKNNEQYDIIMEQSRSQFQDPGTATFKNNFNTMENTNYFQNPKLIEISLQKGEQSRNNVNLI